MHLIWSSWDFTTDWILNAFTLVTYKGIHQLFYVVDGLAAYYSREIVCKSFNYQNTDGWNFIAAGGGYNLAYSRVWTTLSCNASYIIPSQYGKTWTGSMEVFLGCKTCTNSPSYIIHSFKASDGTDLVISFDTLLAPINRKSFYLERIPFYVILASSFIFQITLF